jgi:uncharacterized protein YecE (DUF72 family)
MTKEAKIGTCGFRTNKEEYAGMLRTVEVQHTFYQPPQIQTLEGWRAAMPSGFEFTLKAWMLITHEAKSPTYKRLKRKLTGEERDAAGYFKPTAIVREAWEITLASAKALEARTILFQCPASFKSTKENIKNLEKFFSGIERGRLNFAWEPRGDWDEKTVKKICDDLDLWHTVDPFSKPTVTPEKCYYRLHGRTGYHYKYEEDELAELAAMLPENRISYVFFNNRYMLEDAMVFQKLVEDSTS